MGCAAIGYCAYRYFGKQHIREVRKELVDLKNDVDDVDEGAEVMFINKAGRNIKRKLRTKKLPAIIKASQFAEVKLGRLRDTEANRMVVDKVIRDHMLASVKNGGLGMRVCDVARDHAVATTMYFLPRHSETICDEILALAVHKTKEACVSLGLDGTK